MRAGQVLKLGGANRRGARGLRTWLAIAGGIDVPLVLGSRSTDLKAGFGGHRGPRAEEGRPAAVRPCRALDASRWCSAPFGVRAPDAELDDADGATVLRVMPGPEFEQFTVRRARSAVA